MTGEAKKKSGHGGARPGSGAKKKTKVWSDKLKRSVAKALEKYAKEKGQTFAEVLVSMLYDTKVMDTARLGAAKVIAEILVVKESERVLEKREGPTIGLPPLLPKPVPVREKEEIRLHG